MATETPAYPLLAIDTSSSRTWVGLKTSPDQLAEADSHADSSESLFPLVTELLEKTDLRLERLSSIVYCEGPGSMLSVRTAAMCFRAWAGIGIEAARNLFAYHSLMLGSRLARRSGIAQGDWLIATDARRNAWNTFDSRGTPDPASIQLLENGMLEAETRQILTFSEFARWTKTAATFTELSYDPGPSFEQEAFLELIRPTDNARPLTLRRTDFEKWTPRIHVAPES